MKCYTDSKNRLFKIKSMEEFKEHKSGYLVSTEGRIKGKYVEFLKLTLTTSGYQMCSFGLVHRIVAETFLGEIPTGYEVNHKDGCKHNNKVSNLEIVSSSENQRHAYHNRLQPKPVGELNPMSELTESDVLEIYTLIKEGATNKEIAVKYKLHDRYVSLVRHGKRWKHLWNQHFTNESSILSFGCNSLPLEEMVKIIEMVVEGVKTNTEIAKMYEFDQSTISKVRHKATWKDVWRYYYRNKGIATTIENTGN
jgi:uncharacterized beta-barrel protein YwiB (DUF1934 family)